APARHLLAVKVADRGELRRRGAVATAAGIRRERDCHRVAALNVIAGELACAPTLAVRRAVGVLHRDAAGCKKAHLAFAATLETRSPAARTRQRGRQR